MSAPMISFVKRLAGKEASPFYFMGAGQLSVAEPKIHLTNSTVFTQLT